MKKTVFRGFIIGTIFAAALPCLAFADVGIPDAAFIYALLLYFMFLDMFPTLFFWALAEFFAALKFAGEKAWKTAVMVVVMRVISFIISFVFLLSVSSALTKLSKIGIISAHIENGYLSKITSVFDIAVFILLNTVTDGAVLKLIFKKPFKSNFKWLLGANALGFLAMLLSSVIVVPFMLKFWH